MATDDHPPFDVIKRYQECLDEDTSTPVAMFQALRDLVDQSTVKTTALLTEKLTDAKRMLKETLTDDKMAASDTSVKGAIKNQHKAAIAGLAGVDLFMRFVEMALPNASLASRGQVDNFDSFKANLLERADMIIAKVSRAREEIAKIGARFVPDNGVILVHAYSRMIMSVLLYAAEVLNKRFKVYVTEGRPNSNGFRTAAALAEKDIPCWTILDSSVGYVMDKVEAVFVGAEGVVENGGVINQIGTYQISLTAKALGKPVYVVAESYKFVRVFPLNQSDLPSRSPPIASFDSSPESADIGDEASDSLAKTNPAVDYTPPEYLTLLLTDLGVLTPSGVSDELIKLFCL